MQTEPGKRTNPPSKTVTTRHYRQRPEKPQSVREQFLNLPEGTACQLIAGEIIMTPSPVPLQQTVLMELSYQLLRFVKEQDQGQVFVAPLDVSFNKEN
ncbi:MAG: hypothetical protein D3910_05805, partial [Candidatus Electrothrix sp. ATG2]|nr:hypothetical protein [Candidatus Electrothrix sp. ATG2]